MISFSNQSFLPLSFYLQKPYKYGHRAYKSYEQFWHLAILILISFRHREQLRPFHGRQPNKMKQLMFAQCVCQ
jgi:hypothetical protein